MMALDKYETSYNIRNMACEFLPATVNAQTMRDEIHCRTGGAFKHLCPAVPKKRCAEI